MKIKEDYDKENDIFSMVWGEVEHSRELFDGRIVFDFDKNNSIVGFEIFDYMEEMKKSDKEVARIFKIAEKNRKGGKK